MLNTLTHKGPWQDATMATHLAQFLGPEPTNTQDNLRGFSKKGKGIGEYRFSQHDYYYFYNESV